MHRGRAEDRQRSCPTLVRNRAGQQLVSAFHKSELIDRERHVAAQAGRLYAQHDTRALVHGEPYIVASEYRNRPVQNDPGGASTRDGLVQPTAHLLYRTESPGLRERRTVHIARTFHEALSRGPLANNGHAGARPRPARAVLADGPAVIPRQPKPNGPWCARHSAVQPVPKGPNLAVGRIGPITHGAYKR
jgi:hypothetical protein